MIGLTRKSKGEDEGTHVAQRANIERRIAAEEGLTLLRVEKEKGVSGNKRWRDRELGQALEDIKAGLADGVIVDEVDRLTRERMSAAADIWDAFEAAGAVLIDCKGTDSRDEDGEFNYGLNALIARKQYKQYQRRSNAGRGRAVMENNVHGGSIAPWGYEFTWRERDGKTVHGPLTPADGNRVAEAFEDIISGISHRAFHRKYEIQMGHVVGHRAYLGEAKSGDYVKEGAHPALVTEEVFRRANRRFPKADKGGGRPSKVARPPALLPADVIRCGTCGHGLTRQPSSKGDHYRCQFADCDRGVSIGCDKADNYVLDAVLAWHARDAALLDGKTNSNILLAKDQALEAARAERDALEALQAAGELSPVAYATARTAADAAVAAAGVALDLAEMMTGWRTVPHARVIEKIAEAEACRSFLREYVRVSVSVAIRGRWTPVEERVTLRRVWRDDILAEAKAA